MIQHKHRWSHNSQDGESWLECVICHIRKAQKEVKNHPNYPAPTPREGGGRT